MVKRKTKDYFFGNGSRRRASDRRGEGFEIWGNPQLPLWGGSGAKARLPVLKKKNLIRSKGGCPENLYIGVEGKVRVDE